LLHFYQTRVQDSVKATFGKKPFGKIDNKLLKEREEKESKIGQIFKAVLKIGAGMSKAKEFEDILEDIEVRGRRKGEGRSEGEVREK
jgi:hypothetical protein